ncbi:MAG TPA: universal stress protein [Solirubrobacterales bacterium]|nr:universal stress protein [Solirubrobacterales bacterium]
MACYHRILVAVDGSPDAAAALAHAVTLARDQNARITLLTVAPPTPKPIAVGASAPPDLLDAHEELLRKATAQVPGDVGVTARLERGNAAETILRLAGDHDLVVMGSHGHSRVHRALLGSVSERVLKASKVPVLLMRGGEGMLKDSESLTPNPEKSPI